MMQFTFKRPPTSAIVCYVFGFIVIAITMLHQFLQWHWVSVKTNQQGFIIGALIVSMGSVLNWLIPFITKKKSEDQSK